MTAFTRTEQHPHQKFSSGVLFGTDSDRLRINASKRPQSTAIRQSTLSQRRSQGSLSQKPTQQTAGYLNIDDQGGAASTQTPEVHRNQNKNGNPLKNVQITPELASAVVKEYLLPMFESDGKKILKRKGSQQKQES